MGPAKVGPLSGTTWSCALPTSSGAEVGSHQREFAPRVQPEVPMGLRTGSGLGLLCSRHSVSGGTPRLLHATPEGDWASEGPWAKTLAGCSASDEVTGEGPPVGCKVLTYPASRTTHWEMGAGNQEKGVGSTSHFSPKSTMTEPAGGLCVGNGQGFWHQGYCTETFLESCVWWSASRVGGRAEKHVTGDVFCLHLGLSSV